jgi:hypothetical protein
MTSALLVRQLRVSSGVEGETGNSLGYIYDIRCMCLSPLQKWVITEQGRWHTRMAEPIQNTRKTLGVWVLAFLAVFSFIAWKLNAAYWKDIK